MRKNPSDSLEYSRKITRELYVSVNALLTSLSELQEMDVNFPAGMEEAKFLLLMIETNGKDLRELIAALNRLSHAAVAKHQNQSDQIGPSD